MMRLGLFAMLSCIQLGCSSGDTTVQKHGDVQHRAVKPVSGDAEDHGVPQPRPVDASDEEAWYNLQDKLEGDVVPQHDETSAPKVADDAVLEGEHLFASLLTAAKANMDPIPISTKN